jgi:hypothetical protein
MSSQTGISSHRISSHHDWTVLVFYVLLGQSQLEGLFNSVLWLVVPQHDGCREETVLKDGGAGSATS